MSSLIERMKKQSKLKHTAVLASSKLFDNVAIKHEVPAINIAFSGSVKQGGILPGITTFAGKSKHGKSILGLSAVQQIMKYYKDKGEDCPCLFYDSEFGTPKSYLDTFNIDSENVLHCPITNIEELKFDIVSQLEALTDKDHLVIFIDSIGNAASKKEVEDTMADKSTADMTRAKQLKSMFRMITPYMRIKKIHMVVINHTYETIEMFSKTVVGGGCFTAGTNVIMADGTLQQIQNIKVGDQVMTYDGAKTVLTAWDKDSLIEPEPTLYTVTFDDGLTITCSDTHPFMVNSEWVQAQNLVQGMVVDTPDTTGRVIKSSVKCEQAIDNDLYLITGTNGDKVTLKGSDLVMVNGVSKKVSELQSEDVVQLA